MNSIQIIYHINKMIHEDDNKVRHFLQNYDMLPIIEEFLKNQNFLKERINIEYIFSFFYAIIFILRNGDVMKKVLIIIGTILIAVATFILSYNYSVFPRDVQGR